MILWSNSPRIILLFYNIVINLHCNFFRYTYRHVTSVKTGREVESWNGVLSFIYPRYIRLLYEVLYKVYLHQIGAQIDMLSIPAAHVLLLLIL